MKRFLGLGLLVGALVVLGGGGGGSNPATASADIGVPECDDYLKKYQACIDGKVPESGRATVRQALDQTKAAWKQAASTPQGKAGLATGCKMALDTAKTAMGPYGCTW